jgi:cytochrome c-type biogenesis protein CcmF
MITELGHFALILALLVSAVQATLPLIGAARGNRPWMAMARSSAIVQFTLVALAFAALMHAYVTSDFSLAVVAENSHTDKPMIYKIAAVWGNHEGSMLLWVFILALYGVAVALVDGGLPPALRARVLAVQAMISAGFLLFILLTSNPFLRLDPAPMNGNGLNPLLQDPGLAFHPPMLYLGYVGFSMAFSFAVAALIEGRVDAAWARWVRPWSLMAWCCLTLGIAMGSWWAYYTLGWGGWWYWDPVENASFMPWLAGTALLHSAVVVEKRDSLKAWTVLLAIITFSLSLLGTFLVRSGILTSVHSFASDPARGVFVLALLIVVTGGSLVLFAFRASTLKSDGLFAPISREGGLLLNNVLLSTAAGTVLLGTLYPVLADALDLGKLSVGPPFFNMVFLPLMVPLIMAMGVGPMLSWKRGDLGGALSRLKFAFVLALLIALAGWLAAGGTSGPWWAAGGLLLAAWLFLGTLTEWIERTGLLRMKPEDSWRRIRNLPRAAHGMTLAHIGMAVAIAGITGATAWRIEKIQVMHLHDEVEIGGYQLTLDSVEDNIPGPNYTIERAQFTARKDGRAIAVLLPEKRQYHNPPRPTTNAAIRTNLLGDLYAVIGDPEASGGWVTRFYVNPMVPWIFLGFVFMSLGGVLSLSDRRYRIGAPRRKTLPDGALGAK